MVFDRGDQTLFLTDASDANEGVLIVASPFGGVTPATIGGAGACSVVLVDGTRRSAIEFDLNAGDAVVLTCTSVTCGGDQRKNWHHICCL